MNVCGYCRVSTAIQASEERYSLPEQKERIEAYCKAKGWNLVKVYTDGGYTGANTDRPALKQMLHDCEIYDAVVVLKLDRLSRSQRDTLALIEEFQAKNCAFVSLTESFDTSTPTGRAMLGIMAVFAELERSQIKERTALGRQGRAKQGKWHGGGHPPVGYSYDKQTGTLVPNDEADQVRLIYQMFLDGHSYVNITKFMHERYTTRYTSYNNACTVIRMLKNPVYIGSVNHRGEIIPDCHEPIIDKDTFDAVQSILISRRNGNKNAAGRHLLSGMVFCECGKHMTLNTVGKYKYFFCSRRYSHNLTESMKPCDNRRVREDALNKVIKDSILSLKFSDLKQKKREKTVNNDRELAKIDRQISKLIELYTIESIPIEEVKSRIEALEKKKALLTAPEAPRNDFKVQKDILSRAREAFDSDEVTLARMVVDSLVERVTVRKDVIEVKWTFL